MEAPRDEGRATARGDSEAVPDDPEAVVRRLTPVRVNTTVKTDDTDNTGGLNNRPVGASPSEVASTGSHRFLGQRAGHELVELSAW